MTIGVGMLVFSISFLSIKLKLPTYFCTIGTQSDFIEEHYVDPNGVRLSFPEEKQNLIYILLESMEGTYATNTNNSPDWISLSSTSLKKMEK